MEAADFSAPKFPLVEPSRDFSNIWAKRGIAMAAKIPMIATTIISSINVKPFAFKRIITHLLLNLCSSDDPQLKLDFILSLQKNLVNSCKIHKKINPQYCPTRTLA